MRRCCLPHVPLPLLSCCSLCCCHTLLHLLLLLRIHVQCLPLLRLLLCLLCCSFCCCQLLLQLPHLTPVCLLTQREL
jgi:hypothetical protein